MKKISCAILITLPMMTIAQDWISVGQAGVTDGDEVRALEYFDGALVMAGDFEEVENTAMMNIARFENGQWGTMGSGFDNQVFDLCIYDDELYACGNFQQDGNDSIDLNSLARWNGNEWENVAPNDWYYVLFMRVIDGIMYIGRFDDNFFPVLSTYDGTTFTDLSYEFSSTPNYYDFSGVVEFNNDLYAYGRFDSVNGVAATHIAQFDGGTVASAGFPCPGRDSIYLNGWIDDAVVMNGKLYVGGIFNDFDNLSFAPAMASFDGTSWTAHPLDSNTSTNVRTLEVSDEFLFVGGDLERWNETFTATLGSVAAFDPETGSYTDLGFYNAGGSGDVYDLLLMGDTLYAAGDFALAGTSSASAGISKRSISDVVLGRKDLNTNSEFALYPNPSNARVSIAGASDQTLIQLFDLQGRILRSFRGNSLDVSELDSGIYVLTISETLSLRMVVTSK